MRRSSRKRKPSSRVLESQEPDILRTPVNKSTPKKIHIVWQPVEVTRSPHSSSDEMEDASPRPTRVKSAPSTKPLGKRQRTPKSRKSPPPKRKTQPVTSESDGEFDDQVDI